MADSKRYMDWYEKSLKDLEGARILFKYGGDFSIVAFHCQQSLEKLLKGYILKETVISPQITVSFLSLHFFATTLG